MNGFKMLFGRRKRVARFALVGCSGVLLSFAIMYVGVDIHGGSPQFVYTLQLIVVVEWNFIGNRFLTWNDRKDTSLLKTFARFHFARLWTIMLNQLLFWGLTASGIHYLAANACCIILTSAVNYFAADKFIFRSIRYKKEELLVGRVDEIAEAPLASFVIPVKNSLEIAETLVSIERQDWPGTIEVILVGDFDDETWRCVDPTSYGNFTVQMIEVAVSSPGRDANVKRSEGLRCAQGEILCIIDSDVVLRPDWLMRTWSHMTKGYRAVAGPLVGIGTGFWNGFIDSNKIARKMPSFSKPTILNRSNVRRKKPPVTANFACRRGLYEIVGGPRTSFTNSYEDYELFSRVLKNGFAIMCDPELSAHRYHRQGLKPLMREYARSGRGCADFVITHPTCPFAQTRMIQVAALLLGFTLFLTGLVLATVSSLVLAGIGIIGLTGLSVLKVKTLASAVYPLLAVFFTTVFVVGFVSRFVRRGIRPTVEPIIYSVSHRSHR